MERASGLQNAPDLCECVRILAAADVFDDGDTDAMVERLVRERERRRVLDAQLELGIDRPPRLDPVRKAVDTEPASSALCSQERGQELRPRDIEATTLELGVSNSPELVVPPRIEGHDQPDEARSSGWPSVSGLTDEPSEPE